MTDIEVAWLAGILEGEGSFHLMPSGSARISIAMTDKDVIEKIHRLLPKSRMYGPVKHARRKPIYVINLNISSAVEETCRLILPHMGIRRAQRISEVLAYVEARKAKRLNGNKRFYSHRKAA